MCLYLPKIKECIFPPFAPPVVATESDASSKLETVRVLAEIKSLGRGTTHP